MLATNSANGAVTPDVHRIVEVATSLNYVDSTGQWRPSMDIIGLGSNGFAAAVQGPHRVYFNPDPTADSAVTIVTKSNRVFQVRVLGVYLYDPVSGQEVLLAAPSPAAVPMLHPPNQVVYSGAFNSDVFQGDLRYTYTKAGIESDVVITRQPKTSPGASGLNPATARLQVRHQWLTPAPPLISQRVAQAGPGPDLIDQQLDFGDLWFPSGRAFAWDGTGPVGTNVPAQITLLGAADQVPVGKEYWQTNNVGILTESVTWSSIAPQLAQLPLMADASRPSRQTELATLKPRSSSRTIQSSVSKRSFQLATAVYRTKGVVLDWIIVSGSGSYTFNTGVTYWLTGSSGYFSGTVTFMPGCILKYAPGASPIMYGAIVCGGTPGSPSILTSQDDTFYGQNISQNSPPRLAGTALWIYYISANITISGMNIRYANVAAEFDVNGGCASATETFANSAVFSCNTGINIYYPNVIIQNSICARVPTPTACLQECCTLTGNFTDVSSATDPNGLCYLSASFPGLHTTQANYGYPPDTMGAVGPNHFVEAVNDEVAVYSKSSGLRLTPETSLETFFSVTVPSGPYAGNYPRSICFDPRIVYDQGSQRWIASAIDDGSHFVLLAVSYASDPWRNGGGTWVPYNWAKYVVPMDPAGGDFDRLGVDGNGIYITCTGADTDNIAALPKSPFLNGTAQTVQDKKFIFSIPGIGYISLLKTFPAVNFDPVGPLDPVWLVGDDNNNGHLYYNYLEWVNGFTQPPVFQLTTWGQLTITPSFLDIRLSFHDLLAPQPSGTVYVQSGSTLAAC